MIRCTRLAHDQRGASALEFALAAPILILVLIGIAQLGILYSANAGLQQAVDEGARLATLYPRPTDSSITNLVNQKKFSLNPAFVTGPNLTHGTSNGVSYVDITMSYAVPLDFIVFRAPAVTLHQTRRAYQP